MHKWKDPDQTTTELVVEFRTTDRKMSIRSPKDQYRNVEARAKIQTEAQTKTKLAVDVQTTTTKLVSEAQTTSSKISSRSPNDQQQN